MKSTLIYIFSFFLILNIFSNPGEVYNVEWQNFVKIYGENYEPYRLMHKVKNFLTKEEILWTRSSLCEGEILKKLKDDLGKIEKLEFVLDDLVEDNCYSGVVQAKKFFKENKDLLSLFKNTDEKADLDELKNKKLRDRRDKAYSKSKVPESKYNRSDLLFKNKFIKTAGILFLALCMLETVSYVEGEKA